MKLLDAKPGDTLDVIEGPNPHRNGEKRAVTIHVVAQSSFGDGFYFVQAGKTQVHHSNLFVWGVESVTKVHSTQLESVTYKLHTWTVTGDPEIDAQLSAIGKQYKVFNEYAPKRLQRRFYENEENNAHSENCQMVLAFLEHLKLGGKPELFKGAK